MKIHENLEQLIQEVTGINDPKTIGNIKQNVNRYAKQVACRYEKGNVTKFLSHSPFE